MCLSTSEQREQIICSILGHLQQWKFSPVSTKWQSTFKISPVLVTLPLSFFSFLSWSFAYLWRHSFHSKLLPQSFLSRYFVWQWQRTCDHVCQQQKTKKPNSLIRSQFFMPTSFPRSSLLMDRLQFFAKKLTTSNAGLKIEENTNLEKFAENLCKKYLDFFHRALKWT